MFAEDGLEKINSIDSTLKIYGQLSAGELVDLTHKESTPWAISGRGRNKDEIIKNETIKKFHCNEK